MLLHPSLVPAFHVDESPASACSRVGILVGRTARDLCLDMGLVFQDIVDGRPEALETFAFACGLTDGRLPAMPVFGESRRFTIAGETLTRETLSRQSLRVCPHCVAGDIAVSEGDPDVRPYGRTRWLVASIRTCHVHRCPLVLASDDGRPQVLHDFTRLLAPNLDRVLADMPPTGTRIVSELEESLFARLSGRPVTGWLASFPAYAACRIAEMVGAVSVFGRRFAAADLDDGAWHAAGGVGFEIADAGPAMIGEFLHELAGSFAQGREAWGARAVFGRLYEWLAHESEDVAYDPLRQVIREFVIETLPVGPGDELFGTPVERRRVHSIHSFAAEAGRHPKTVRKLLLDAGLIGHDSRDLSDERVLFPADAADRLLVDQAGVLTQRAMAARLGAPRPHDKLLVDAGFVRPRPVGDGGQGLRAVYAIAEVDDFLKRLTRAASPSGPRDPDVLNIPSAAKKCNCSAMEIVPLLLDGRLATVRLLPDVTGYMAVLVDPEEVQPLVRREEHGGLSLRKVSGMMRTTDQVLKALVQAGHLPTRRAINPVNRCPQTVVDPADLDAFVLRYVSAPEIARVTGRHAAVVMRALQDASVSPAFDPAKVGVSFYERTDLPSPWRPPL